MGALLCRPEVPSVPNYLTKKLIQTRRSTLTGQLPSITSAYCGQLGKVLLERYLSTSASIAYYLWFRLLQVQIVQHKQSKSLYALKYINKSKCVRMKAVPNIIQERRLLEEVISPSKQSYCPLKTSQIECMFVVNMRYAFQDDDHCYLVLDLMLGGDLRCTLFKPRPGNSGS